MQQYPGMGELIVKVVSGGVAFPVDGALVTVSGRDKNGMSGVIYSLRTDESGATSAVALPAPERGLSLFPGLTSTPYSLYDIKVTKNGFLDSENGSVQIFDGVRAIQGIRMIPQLYDGTGTRTNSPLPPSNGELPQLKEVEETEL